MKAEQRHRLEQNALAERVVRVVQTVKAAPATQSLALWLGVAAVIIVIIAWQFFRSASYTETSFLWRTLDSASRGSDDVLHSLESLRDDHPGTTVGTSAGYQLARFKFEEGQANLDNTLELDRKEAIKKLIAAREMYSKLGKDSADLPLLAQESMMMQAKIDESLTGVADPDKPGEILGSLAKAKEQYQALATKYPDSAAGIAAKKRLEDLEKNQAQVEDFYVQLNALLAAPRPQSPLIHEAPEPIFPSLPKLPADLTNPETKPPVSTPPAAKPGENKAPAPSTTPKPPDGKANSTTTPSMPPKVPSIPTTQPPAKPTGPATPKAGDDKLKPPAAPDKKQ